MSSTLFGGDLSASAQAVIDKQGVTYTDEEGDLVTSIVGGKDCVFTCYEKNCCLCALERSYRNGKTGFVKPISCSLYPIRVKEFSNGTCGIKLPSLAHLCRCKKERGRAESSLI